MDQDQLHVDPYALARALLGNSEALIADAELLLAHGRHARAAALSLMAMEEFSKIRFCLEAIMNGTPIPVAGSPEWRAHRGKLLGARALEMAFIDPVSKIQPEKAHQAAQDDQNAKMRCLYVDHDDGRISSPSSIVVDAAQRLQRAQEAANFMRPFIQGMSPEALRAVVEDPATRDDFESLVDEDDLQGTIERLRRKVADSVGGHLAAGGHSSNDEP